MTTRVYIYGALIFLAIILGYGIPITVLRNTLTVQYVPELGTCIYGTAFIELSFAIVWAGWVSVIIVTIVARNINTSFNEYKEMVIIIILSSITLTYETITHNIVREYVLYRWSRTLSTYMEYLASQTALFVLLGVPIYNCIFNREGYKRQFFEKMRADGMVARYNYTIANTTGSTNVVSTAISSEYGGVEVPENANQKNIQNNTSSAATTTSTTTTTTAAAAAAAASASELPTPTSPPSINDQNV
ncbi:hypothetical protein EV178_005956 [Coemansia sp. RSA 1646]|nr:hypothetical protein EV178_005956 [Coemansia sp. RSA 1646]